MYEKNVLSTVKKHLTIFTQLLILFSFSIPKNTLFSFIIIFPKYITIIILTSNFCISVSNEYYHNSNIARALRKFTLFNVLHRVEVKQYYIISIILLFIQLIFIIYILYYYFQIKIGKGEKLKLSLFPKILYFFYMIFGQYLIEYFSYIFVLVFRKKFYLHQTGIFAKYNNIPIVNDPNNDYNLTMAIIISIFHVFEIILMNFIIYYSLIITNSIYKTKKEILNYKHLNWLNIFVIYSNFFGLHYYETILTEKNRNFFKGILCLIIFIVILVQTINNIFYYEKPNLCFYCIRFLNLFCFISLIFEVTVGLSKSHYKLIEVYSFNLLKIIVTFLVLNYLTYLRDKHMLLNSLNFLFEEYEINRLPEMVESYNFILDKLLDVKNRKNTAEDLINLLMNHKKICFDESCKCKYIQPLPPWNLEDNKEYTWKLIKGLGFLMETTFVNLENFNNINFVFFIVDYFCHIKQNMVFAYSVLQSYLSRNFNKLSILDSFELYCFNYHYIKMIRREYDKNFYIIKFRILFDEIIERIEFNKNIIKYSDIIQKLIEIKINFENSMKFSIDPDSKEILGISSLNLNRKIFNRIIKKLIQLNKTAKNFRANLFNYIKNKKNVEFYYITFLFYSIFQNHIPDEILNSFKNVSYGESFKNLTFEDLSYKFDKYVNKYIENDNIKNQIIIKFSNGIKIKYISSNLCNKLGYNQNSLLKSDFGRLFPRNIRDEHTKAMLNYIMVHKNLYFIKNTFIFDNNELMFPCEIRAGTLPHFSKNLMVICEVELKKYKNDDYYFLIDNKLNGIAITKNLEERFHLSISVLKKCEIRLIDIFELHEKQLLKNFKKTISSIKKLSKELEANDLEHYAKNLFNLSLNKDENNSEIKYISNKNSLEISNTENYQTDLSILYDKKKIEYFHKKISKAIILQNIIKTLNKLSDSSSKDENIKILVESIYSLQKNLSITSLATKNNLKRNSSLHKRSINSRKSNFNININNSSKSYQILLKGKVKKIYDIPLFLFKFNDKYQHNFLDHQNSISSLTKFSRLNSITKNNKNKINKQFTTNSTLNSIKKKKTNEIFFRKTTKSLNVVNKKEETEVITFKFDIVTNNELAINTNVINEKNDENIKTLNFSDIFKKIEFYFILITLNCFGISIYNVYYNMERLSNVEIIGRFYSEINFLTDKLVYLYSSLTSFAFELMGYTNGLEKNFDLMLDYLYLNIYSLSNALNLFIDSMRKYEKKITIDYSKYLNFNFIKNCLNWETNLENKTLITELYYLIYLAKTSLIDFNYEEVQNDLNKFIFLDFKNNETELINTNFMMTLYYMYNNFDNIIFLFYVPLKSYSYSKFKNFLKISNEVVIVTTTVWLLLNLIFFLLCYIIIRNYNYYIFKKIVLMFESDYQTFDKNTFKNRPENYYMKYKINLFLDIVNNFNNENKEKFQNFKENFKNNLAKYLESSIIVQDDNNNNNENIQNEFEERKFSSKKVNELAQIVKINSNNNLSNNLNYSLNNSSMLGLNINNSNNNVNALSSNNLVHLNKKIYMPFKSPRKTVNDTKFYNTIKRKSDKNSIQSNINNNIIIENSNTFVMNNNNSTLNELNNSEIKDIPKANTKKKEVEINGSQFYELLEKKSLILNYFYIFLILIFIILSLVIFYFHIKNSLDYNETINYLERTLNAFINFFQPIPFIFTILRINIITHSNLIPILTNFSLNISSGLKEISDITSDKKFSLTSNLKKFWNQINLPINNEEIDLEYLCNYYSLCVLFLNKSNGICSESVFLGYNVIIQKYINIINDYLLFQELNENMNRTLMENFIYKNSFSELQENSEIIFSLIQTNFYYNFLLDFQDTKESLKKKTEILNIIFFLFEFIVIFILMIMIYFWLKKQQKYVEKGSKLFKNAFFKEKIQFDCIYN